MNMHGYFYFIAHLIVTINRTIYNTAMVCIGSDLSCFQDDKTMISFLVSVKDDFGCVTYQSNITIDNGCFPFNAFPMNMGCASTYHLQIEVYGKIIHRGPIMHIPGYSICS